VLETSVPVRNIQIIDPVCYVSKDKTGNVFINVIFKRVREEVLQWKSNTVSQCASGTLFILHSKSMPVYYIVISDRSGSTIFSTLSHKWNYFQRKLLNVKYLFWFSAQLSWNMYHSINNSGRWNKCKYVFMLSNNYSCQILVNFEFSRQIFEKGIKYQI
jgi:hypothetical protein